MKKLICSGWTIVAMWIVFLGLTYTPLANAQKFSDWGPPVNLGPTINFPGANTQHPALSRNGLSL